MVGEAAARLAGPASLPSLAGAFLAGARLAGALRAGAFFAAVFLAGAFFAVARLAPAAVVRVGRRLLGCSLYGLLPSSQRSPVLELADERRRQRSSQRSDSPGDVQVPSSRPSLHQLSLRQA